ncbi:MAG: hypothetical protein LBV02_02490 [Bacteroidales bacterium]|jgi:hypothetical protein|nr:hypothetical protein [Bacteroidales bacterium]
MTAFHTENGVLEERIQILNNPSQRHKWLLSKFMSQMLTHAFETFSFKIPPIDYALMAQDFLTEAKEEIILGGSYSPYSWLKLLSKKDNIIYVSEHQEKSFFNNEILHYPIPDQEKKQLHSYFLSRVASFASKRYVLLSEYDRKYLHLIEQCLDEYFYLNTIDGKQKNFVTYFISPEMDKHRLHKKVDAFFKQETALYDKSLLLQYDKSSEILSCCIPVGKKDTNAAKDINAAIEFYDTITKDNLAISYNNLKKRISEEKRKLWEPLKTLNPPKVIFVDCFLNFKDSLFFHSLLQIY